MAREPTLKHVVKLISRLTITCSHPATHAPVGGLDARPKYFIIEVRFVLMVPRPFVFTTLIIFNVSSATEAKPDDKQRLPGGASGEEGSSAATPVNLIKRYEYA